ncbi:MAG: PDZ domain-containing protein [Planctomycetota bacterium]
MWSENDKRPTARAFERVQTKDPPHFDACKRFESKAAGLTVRNLTYEVRRYYQLGPEDPGLIISKIEPGPPAAVAGLVPNELILAVNDQPLQDVDHLRDTLAPGGEFHLNVRRMTVGRLVTLKVEAESEKERWIGGGTCCWPRAVIPPAQCYLLGGASAGGIVDGRRNCEGSGGVQSGKSSSVLAIATHQLL